MKNGTVDSRTLQAILKSN